MRERKREKPIVSEDAVICTATDIPASKCFLSQSATFLCHLPEKMPDLRDRAGVGGNLPKSKKQRNEG
jgi:hypothetical protein